jgi:hypothetical protein
MKKFLVTIAWLLAVVSTYADEGMWLPHLLGQQVYNNMVKRGLKLTKEQLYSINKSSLKDAIIIFGGGCTGEIVSNEGLIFTNHHCGYGAIAAASTVEHNYLQNGFYARAKNEEIPSAGLSVQFLLRIEDVTKEVETQLQGLSGDARLKKQTDAMNAINARLADPAKSIEARTYSMFKGNQFIAYVYQRYKDIRLVGNPPESIGKYGGDTDNWEWPRHTGDFSIFRVYAAPDGSPADYTVNNVPLKPKYSLPVSIKGLKDGDYSMIYGYPGGTNRYETSYGVQLSTEINNPSLVGLRDVRLKAMFEEMKKDPAVKLQLASSYAGIANYWKFFDGETKQLLKHGVYGQKQKAEAAFIAWAKGKPEFENVFTDYAKAYDAWRPYAKHRQYLVEGIVGSPLASFASSLIQIENALANPAAGAADKQKAIEAAQKARTTFLAAENKPSDRKILAATLMMYYHDIDKAQQPAGFFDNLQTNYGSLDDEQTFKKYAAFVFDNTMLLDDAKWNAFTANPEAATLQQDPAYQYAATFVKNYSGKYQPRYAGFMNQNNELGRLYLKGIMQMEKDKVRYPDANFSMRVSYGNVKSYNPRDALHCDYVCTMNGILEKYVPGDYEFDLPANLLELARKKDYGQYIDPVRKDLVVCFITTNDITGGNSGSPVINGKGELIGLAFDGNYEALSHKMAFDKDLNRTICVDVRYVLWCIDKLGGASNIIKELKLVK